MTHRAIVVDQMKCNGCQICEIHCSRIKEGKVWPEASRIRIFPFFPGLDIVVVCQQCENPSCVDMCPTDAFSRDEETGAISIDPEKCIECGACAEACPLGAIFFHPESKKAIKCDLCGGHPECVKRCPENALEYRMTPFDATASPSEIAQNLKEKLVLVE
jgi:Fe-S-cluster-containing hydrogenase component 2